MKGARQGLVPLFGHDADLVLEYQVAAKPARHCNQERGESRKSQTKRKHRGGGILQPPVPVRESHREHHDRGDKVVPGGSPATDSGNREKFDGAAEAGKRAHRRPTPDQPDRHPGPERVAQEPEGEITGESPQKEGNGEGYQHGVEGVSGYRHHRRGACTRRLRDFFHAHGCISPVALGLLATACGTDGPMSTLQPAGPAAEQIAKVWWVMLGGGLVILAGVVALALHATFRPSRAAPERLRLWFLVGGGLIFTPFVLLVLLFYGLRAGHALLPLSTDRDVFTVQVIGHQWWWEVRYPDGEGGTLYSANEIHVPVGRPVDIEVTGADVIHSFWIPRLGGKIDAMPGRSNLIRLEVRQPGIYRGQCAEFCGEQHAHMGLLLEAHEADRLEERLSVLREERPKPEGLAGRQAFEASCADCHSLRGQATSPLPGPNLADLAYRHTLGAGTLRNDADARNFWIEHHQELKPGNSMPDHSHLGGPTLQAIARYLELAL